jgi:hypothetical protein
VNSFSCLQNLIFKILYKTKLSFSDIIMVQQPFVGSWPPFKFLNYIHGARGSVAVDAVYYKPEGRRFETRWRHWIFFSFYLIFPAALWPCSYSASNRNEYQRQPHHHLWADSLYNVGTSTSHNLLGLHGLLRRGFPFFLSFFFFNSIDSR